MIILKAGRILSTYSPLVAKSISVIRGDNALVIVSADEHSRQSAGKT